jgi:hypothetical protein
MLPCLAGAQDRHHEMGTFIGTAAYFGDLQNEFFSKNGNNPVGGLMYKYFVNPRVGLRFGANYTQLTAADSLSTSAIRRQRNLNFSTNLFEIQGGLELNMLPVDVTYRKVSPYVFASFAMFYHNPYTNGLVDEKVFLRPLSTEGQGLPTYPERKKYNLVNVAMPLGGGFKFFVGKKVMLTTEFGVRFTTTDYIDDVSQSFVNMDSLYFYRGRQSVDLSYRQDELPNWDKAYPGYGYQRGDNRKYDMYWFAGLGVNIYFNSFGNAWPYRATKCPRTKTMW